MEPQTYREMLAKAQEIFGEQVSLGYDEGLGWTIETGVFEKADMSEFEGTPAGAAYAEYEGNYGSTLERWIYKNGHSGLSLYQAALAYNEQMESNARSGVHLVRRMIAEGRAFDWEGGVEYRDHMLALGEERGW